MQVIRSQKYKVFYIKPDTKRIKVDGGMAEIVALFNRAMNHSDHAFQRAQNLPRLIAPLMTGFNLILQDHMQSIVQAGMPARIVTKKRI